MSLHLVDHPLVHDALVMLRDRRTTSEHFRQAARRISVLMAVEALRDLPTVDVTVETPLGAAAGRQVAGDVVVVPILRAGLSMLDAVLELVPQARVGHIGLQRDERTAVASKYYSKLPSGLERSHILMIDPMLATGGSIMSAIGVLREAGARSLRLACIVAAPEGVAQIAQRYPEVSIYAPVLDRGLNAQKFIVPGLGDFGDRLYGTT